MLVDDNNMMKGFVQKLQNSCRFSHKNTLNNATKPVLWKTLPHKWQMVSPLQKTHWKINTWMKKNDKIIIAPQIWKLIDVNNWKEPEIFSFMLTIVFFQFQNYFKVVQK